MKTMMGESSSNVKSMGDPPSCDGHITYTCVEYNINTGNLFQGDIIVLFSLHLYISEICIG